MLIKLHVRGEYMFVDRGKSKGENSKCDFVLAWNWGELRDSRGRMQRKVRKIEFAERE